MPHQHFLRIYYSCENGLSIFKLILFLCNLKPAHKNKKVWFYGFMLCIKKIDQCLRQVCSFVFNILMLNHEHGEFQILCL